MPRNTTLTVTKDWSEVTDADVTNITLSNRGSDEIEFMATVGAVAPSNGSNPQGILLERGTAIINRALTDLFPGVSGANRVYARTAPGGDISQVFVSHA